LDSKNFILINLNHTINRARQTAIKQERSKWILFGLSSSIFLSLIIWTIIVNNSFNNLIESRESTIENIISKTDNLKKAAEIELSRADILSAYNLGKHFIPWSKKLIQLSEMTPYDMSITKLIYSNDSFTISAISKIEDENKKEQIILNDFMNSIKSNEDFLREFDGIEVKKTKRIDTQKNSHLSFEIVGKLKRRMTNRLDNVTLLELSNQNKNLETN
jgi:hypothetical protein